MNTRVITYNEIKDEIKSGLYGSYIFFGEEEYMKQYCLNEIRRKILGDADDADMRHRKINCSELDFEKITDALTTAPLGFFSDGKVLCELHQLDFSSLKESEWKAFTEILSVSSPDVVTVIYTVEGEFDAGILPKAPSKELKRISDYCKPVNFPRESEIKLARWTAKHFAAEKLSFENGVCEKMVSQCGRDMLSLSNEIGKICCYVKNNGETVVKNADVEKVCSKNLEISAFDFSNALLNFETDKALEILTDMKLKKEKPVYVLSSVLRVVSDLYKIKVLAENGYTNQEISKELNIHEYKVGLYRKSSALRGLDRLERLLVFCTETDIKLKSTSLDNYTELDKLVILAASK